VDVLLRSFASAWRDELARLLAFHLRCGLEANATALGLFAVSILNVLKFSTYTWINKNVYFTARPV
jgi:hypothetical protein